MGKTQANELTATEAIEAIRRGGLRATELCESCIARLESLEPTLHAWVHFDPDLVRRQARAVDEKVAAGTFCGRLYGVPFGVKDVINTADLPTWMGSPIWEGFTPGNDARVVASLRLEGGVMFGKTVTAEFAVHHPGPTLNPYSPNHSPGTSSSGSAAAVAARMVPLALGTQTAGSTIRPASYCGVYGFKPSFGVVPRTGILKTLDTLDHVSFFARSLEDLELFFESARVRGANHPFIHTSLDQWSPEKIRKPYRVALVRGAAWEHAEPYAQKAILGLAEEWAADPDVRLEEVVLPEEFDGAHALHELIYSRTLSYYFQKEYQENRELLSDVFREMVEVGLTVAPEAYWDSMERQQALGKQLDGVFEDYDIILNLSTAGEAPFGLNGRDKKDCCLIWTLCHVPAINLPVFESPSGLPFGALIVARRYNDLYLLSFAKALRDKGRIREWKPPAIFGSPRT
jgi:Asp-tRNA(Asn)/Glu-tRNA(Gln) amidotransferase A subunit family amidase